jgi:hypothetical protein
MHMNSPKGRARAKPYLDDVGEHLGPIVAHHQPAHRELLETRVVLVEPPHGLWDSVGGWTQLLDRLDRDLARVVSSVMEKYAWAVSPSPTACRSHPWRSRLRLRQAYLGEEGGNLTMSSSDLRCDVIIVSAAARTIHFALLGAICLTIFVLRPPPLPVGGGNRARLGDS